jgi:hypothetical protein
MKHTFFFLLIALAIIGCSGGSSSSQKQNGATGMVSKEALNIILLLDLSDRIVKTEGQAAKDQEILDKVLSIFEEAQKRKVYITSNDELKVLIAPQPGVNVTSNDELSINMADLRVSKNNQPIGRPAFKIAKNNFESALGELYDKATNIPYTGADIYTFFCSDYPQNFMNKKPYVKNKIIILTDGYLTFDREFISRRPDCSYMRDLNQLRQAKEKWEDVYIKNQLSMCACDKNFEKTEVMLLETAPLNRGTSVFEFPIVERYWKDWFDSMGIRASIYPHEDQVSNIGTKIKAFLE